MKLLTAYFDRNGKYKKLFTVFKASAEHRIPEVTIEVLKLKHPGKTVNHKFDACYAHLKACEKIIADKKNVTVCDCDLLFLKDISDVWEMDFDIAITVRERIPFNTGIWWYRHNKRSENFIREWIKYTNAIKKELQSGNVPCERFVHYHGGIDQASLATALINNPDVNILRLESVIWNSCQHEWEFINSDTRIVHIKSNLRKYCFGQIKYPPGYLKPIVKTWRKYYENTKKLPRVDRQTKNKKV